MAHQTPHDMMNTHKMEIHMQLDGAHGEAVVAHLKSTMSVMTDNSGCSLLDTICGRDTGFGQPPLRGAGYEGLHLWHTETVPLVDANDVVQQPAAAAPQLQPMMTRYEAYMLVPVRPGGQPPYMTAAEVIRQDMTKYTFFEAAQQVGAGNQPTAAPKCAPRGRPSAVLLHFYCTCPSPPDSSSRAELSMACLPSRIRNAHLSVLPSRVRAPG
jgi:hypothetical protein